MNPREITITDPDGDQIAVRASGDANHPVWVRIRSGEEWFSVTLTSDQVRELASALTGDDTNDGPVDDWIDFLHGDVKHKPRRFRIRTPMLTELRNSIRTRGQNR